MLIFDIGNGSCWTESVDKEWLEKLHEINNTIIEACEELDAIGLGVEYRILFHNIIFESEDFPIVNKKVDAEIKDCKDSYKNIKTIDKAR